MTEPSAHDANLYAPPAASVVDLAAEEDIPQFYVVASTKFLMLFFATFSAYSLYWFWRHWMLQKRRYTLDIWPIARAIFQVFFAHSLNREIDFRLKRVDARYRWSPGAHATVFVIFTIVGNVLDRLSGRSIGSPYVDVLSILTLFPAAYALLQAQKAANAACGDPKGATNARLTPVNYVWLILGLVLWAIIGLGLVAIVGDFE